MVRIWSTQFKVNSYLRWSMVYHLRIRVNYRINNYPGHLLDHFFRLRPLRPKVQQLCGPPTTSEKERLRLLNDHEICHVNDLSLYGGWSPRVYIYIYNLFWMWHFVVSLYSSRDPSTFWESTWILQTYVNMSPLPFREGVWSPIKAAFTAVRQTRTDLLDPPTKVKRSKSNCWASSRSSAARAPLQPSGQIDGWWLGEIQRAEVIAATDLFCLPTPSKESPMEYALYLLLVHLHWASWRRSRYVRSILHSRKPTCTMRMSPWKTVFLYRPKWVCSLQPGVWSLINLLHCIGP